MLVPAYLLLLVLTLFSSEEFVNFGWIAKIMNRMEAEAPKVVSVLVYNGLPVTAGEVVKQVFAAKQSAAA